MIPFYIQNDHAAAKVIQLRQQKALAAEEARRRVELLNQSSRDTSGTHSNDSEAFGRSTNIVLCCTCFERFEERIAYMADVLQWSEVATRNTAEACCTGYVYSTPDRGWFCFLVIFAFFLHTI